MKLKYEIQESTNNTKIRLKSYISLAEELNTDPLREERVKELLCRYCKYVPTMATQAMTTFNCKRCNVKKMWGNGCTPKYCNDCASILIICKHCGADLDLINKRSRNLDGTFGLEGKL